MAPKPQPPPGQADELLDLHAGALDIGQDPPREREQRLAGRSERDVAARPTEQSRAELALERADLLAQRRLRDVDRLGGAREVTRVGHGREVLELPELHFDSLWLSK